jgi:hypothetical protein
MPRNPNVKLERLLSKPLPPEAITVDPSSGLSNIVSAFEVERLNDVFGVNGWHCEYQIVNLDREKGEICVKCTFSAGEIKRESFGGNDNYRLGDALKGACTDALGKVCYQLGIGLDIYKTRNDFRLEKDGAPKDTGKPQYTTRSGLVLGMEQRKEGIWIQINRDTCFVPSGDLAERIYPEAAQRWLAVNAKWWWPDKITPVLLITGILDIEPISAMKIPEIIEKRNKKVKNGVSETIAREDELHTERA